MLFRATIPLSILLASCASATEQSTSADSGVATDANRIVSDDAGLDIDAAPGAPDALPLDAAIPLGDELLITEVVDATLSGGLPKFVELTNHSANSVDLSGYSLGVYSNGGDQLLTGGSLVLSGTLVAGDSYVISFEASDSPGVGRFFEVYGEDPDDFSFSSQINGNDTIILFLSDGLGSNGAATGNGDDATVVDLYGNRGVDGVTEVWEYTNGYAARKSASVTASTTFDSTAWNFSGPEALADVDGPGIAAVTSPGTH